MSSLLELFPVYLFILETEIFEDEDDHEPHLVTHELHDLDLGTTYNISILPNNTRGDGKMSQAFVIFTTEGKQDGEGSIKYFSAKQKVSFMRTTFTFIILLA